jgi:hypothetical protein
VFVRFEEKLILRIQARLSSLDCQSHKNNDNLSIYLPNPETKHLLMLFLSNTATLVRVTKNAAEMIGTTADLK